LKLKRNADNSEWMEKEFIAAGLTLVGGLILFTLSQAVLKLLDPCVEFKKYIAKIGADLDFYHEYKYASIADRMNAALAFRKHASGLEEHFNSIFQSSASLERLATSLRPIAGADRVNLGFVCLPVTRSSMKPGRHSYPSQNSGNASSPVVSRGSGGSMGYHARHPIHKFSGHVRHRSKENGE
jgi:hypothetical protein